MLDGQQIGFIGAGQMARALARGFVEKELVSGIQLAAYDPEPSAARQFQAEIPQCKLAASNRELVQQSNIVVLAVKPQSFAAVAESLDASVTANRLFLSILAGTPLAKLQAGLGTRRIVRIMPNTPCLIGKGAAAFAMEDEAAVTDQAARGHDIEIVERLFRAVGSIVQVPEKLLDAVTGLSGSGPAYVYLLIEALSDGGVRMGLPRSIATSLAAQTIAGAAEMVLQSAEHPGVLKDRVTSPGGTTIAGLQVLERRGVRSAMIDAVEAATLRSQELGN